MIYEYQCKKCHDRWTLHRKVAERDDPTTCPECGSPGRKILSAVPSYFRRTHPDVKQDMHEMVAGIPPSNHTEV